MSCFFLRPRWLCVFALLALSLVSLTCAAEADVDRCPTLGREEEVELRKKVRLAVCRTNSTSQLAFQQKIKDKHGGFPNQRLRYGAATFFQLSVAKIRCRYSCPNVSPENITWCINIVGASGRETLETCLRTDGNRLQFNSTCDAQALKLQDHLSVTECAPFPGVGCLGLTNIDWFFNNAFLVCTTHTDTCYQKNFFQLSTRSETVTEPEIDFFTASPYQVEPGDMMILHAEVSSTTDKNHVSWHHGNTNYTQYIKEDPYCNRDVEDCPTASHVSTIDLRMRRVRLYYLPRRVLLPGCGTINLYHLESYLIVNRSSASDAGDYVFKVSSVFDSAGMKKAEKNVTTVVVCNTEKPSKVSCSYKDGSILSLGKGESCILSCNLTAPPTSKLSWKTEEEEVAGEEGRLRKCKEGESMGTVMASFSEKAAHVCRSHFSATIQVCGADHNIAGQYQLVILREGQREVVDGTLVTLKMDSSSSGVKGSKDERAITAAYATPVAILVMACLLVALAILVVLRLKKRRRMGRINRRVQSRIIKEIPSVKDSEAMVMSPLSHQRSDLHVAATIQDPLEFPRNRLYITNKILGEGSFGRVVQARAESIVAGMPEMNIVAVKTTKDNATSVEREELLAELDLMRNLEPHENILNLLGQCTTPGGPVCLIVEYASYGNLRDFLRQCEEVVLSLNHIPHIPRNSRSRTRTFSATGYGSAQPLITRQDSVFTPSNGYAHFTLPSPPTDKGSSLGSAGGEGSVGGQYSAQHPGTATPLAHTVAPLGHDYINTKGLVYMEDVHNFALQIACGLEHIASLQIVHCDLAARNVLIAEGFVLKIADFGLARNISGTDFYKKNPRGKIPVKWTAPEALEKRVFTTKSDVWSYGVVLWELFTYGHTPYPDVQLGPSYEPFIAYLKEGHRMTQPDSSPPSFYELMLQCWHLNPDLRPSPNDIVAQLTPLETIHNTGDSEVNGGHQIVPE